MTDHRHYTDTTNVVDSIEALEEQFQANSVDEETSGRLYIMDAPQIELVAVPKEEMDERNLWATLDMIDDAICSIEWETNQFMSRHMHRLHFHESAMTYNEAFQLVPVGTGVIDADQATDPRALGDGLDRALTPLVDERDAMFTFVGVEAGSMASAGHFTDFEFEYAID